MPVSDDIQWLYESMSRKGYNVGKSAEEFDKLMRTRDDSRKWVYDKATAEGLDVGKDAGEFDSIFGYGAPQPVVSTAPQADAPSQVDTMASASGVANSLAVKAEPVQKAQVALQDNPSHPQSTPLSREEMMSVGGQFGDFARGVSERSEELADPAGYKARKAEEHAKEVEARTSAGRVYKPREGEIARMRGQVNAAAESLAAESPRERNVREYYAAVRPGENSPVVKGAPVYNAESGEMEARYLNEDGGEYASKGAAQGARDMMMAERTEQDEIAKIYDAWAKEHPNASVEEREVAMNEAYARRQWYAQLRNIDSEIDRLERLAKEQDNIAWPETGNRVSGLAGRTAKELSQYKNDKNRQDAAARAGGYRMAIERLLEAKGRYERGEQNVDSNWLVDLGRGMGAGLKEMVTNPFGLTSMAMAGKDAAIKDKIEKGEKLDGADEAYIDAVIFGLDTEQFSKERGKAYNVGESVALLAEMAAEFGLNPASGLTRTAVANSVKAFGKAAAKKILIRPGVLVRLRAVGAAGTAKAFAPAAGAALGEGAVIAGTTQLPKNLAEMKTRKTGQPVRTESGYTYEGGVGTGEAFVKSFGKAAGSNAIFLPSLGIKGFGGTMEKAAGKLFGEKGAKMAGEMAGAFNIPGKVLPLGNLPEGALKMKTSELLDVMVGDESMTDWANPEKNMETLVVLLTAEFMMGLPQKAVQGKDYHNVAKAKMRATQSYAEAMEIFAKGGKQEVFDDFQARMRTVDSPEEAMAILFNAREHLSEAEVKALYDLTGAMFRYKGATDYYNARYRSNRKSGQGDASTSTEADPGSESNAGGLGAPVEEMRTAADEARTDGFTEGYQAESVSAQRDLKTIYDARREALEARVGKELVDMIDNLGDEFDIAMVDEAQRQQVMDYISARSAWEGMSERLNDDGAERISEAEALVDSRTNQSDGMVQELMLANGDGLWWLRNGVVNALGNGEIDRTTSSDVIFAVNANGEVKSFALSDVVGLGERVSPDVLKEQAREVEALRRSAAESAMGGRLSFEPGESGKAMIDGSLREFTIDGPAMDAEGQPVEGAVVVTLNDGSKMEIGADALQKGLEDYTNSIREQEMERMAPPEPAVTEAYEQTPKAQPVPKSAMELVPKDEAGKPMFTAVDPETAWDAISEAFPSEASAQEWVRKQAAKAKGALVQLEKGKYEVPDDFEEAARVARKREEAIAQAKEHAVRWEAIAAVQNARKIKAAEIAAAERRAKEAEAEQQRQEKLREQGANMPHPSVKERWEKADKIYGLEDEITLADGTTVRGRYVLTEAGAATPSHDPQRNFAPSEGFPTDENGNTPNDRDYQRDAEAQQLVRGMAANYDGRAIQNPVIVTPDGVVISGNNRVMSGDEAALMGTDAANIAYQRKYGSRYGFNEEQVGQRNHPRIYFELSEAVPYTTENFAKFNRSGMKSQSKTETAVKLGKTVSDGTFTRLAQLLGDYERLSDFYSDSKAGNEALSVLVSDGVVMEADLPALRSGDGLSGAGRDLIENILVGKAFDSDPEAVRRLAEIPSMRQIVVTALTEIANNAKLKQSGYALGEELSKAIGLVYDARTSGGESYAYGKPVSSFGRQMGLFGDGSIKDATVLLLADLLNSKKVNRLRDVLAAYNRRGTEAAAGQLDMFSLDTKPESKDVILKAVLEKFDEYGKGTERDPGTQQAENASRRNRGDGESATGEPGGEYRGLIDDVDPAAMEEPGGGYQRSLFGGDEGGIQNGLFDDMFKRPDDDVRSKISKAESQVETNPTDAQKEAGNYRKGHVTVDGYNITIEQPKGSMRRGTDANGKSWESKMNHTYGYIRGTKGVDGDHIDIFLSDNPVDGDVFVVDQYNPDGTFDEHKVMYGFGSEAEAKEAYLSNYEKGWENSRRIDITGVSKEEFRKWVDSSTRKTKPFAEYKNVKAITSGKRLSEERVSELLSKMESRAEVAPILDLTPEKWREQFGEDGKVKTPVGVVKMGEHQFVKLFSRKRAEYFGMIKPTLTQPDVIIEKDAPVENAERSTKYLFIKTFVKSDGSRIIHFESITVKRDGMEVSISSHEAEAKDIKKDMQKGKILHISDKLSLDSEWSLTEAPKEVEGSDLVPTSDNLIPDSKERQAEREDGQLLILPSETSEEAGALSSPTFGPPNMPNPPESKGSELLSVKQERSGKNARKIDDFGEKIEGARKDALSRIAKTLDNVTAKALVELPLGKAVGRPDFGKSIALGEMDERDAMGAEALWQTVYGSRKPANSSRNRTKIARWGEDTAKKIERLRVFLAADSEKRAEMIREMGEIRFPDEATEQAEFDRIREWNKDRHFLLPVFTPAPEGVTLAVMERVGMRPGDKRKIEFRIGIDVSHQYYELLDASGKRVFGFDRQRSLDSAIEDMAMAIRIATGDLSVTYPARSFRVVGVDPIMRPTGRYSVSWIKGREFAEKQFDNPQEAESFAAGKREAGIPASTRQLHERTGEYKSYKVVFTNPVTGEGMDVDKSFANRIDAKMAIDEDVDGLSALVNEKYATQLNQTKEANKLSHFFVTTVYDRKGRHFVVARNDRSARRDPFQNPVVKEFATRKEAEEWFAQNVPALEEAYAEEQKRRREFVFFKPSKAPRRGVDRRGGRDVTPAEFGDTFGFRGVQFGNWTKDADRQTALNEAYDAFLDMADVLGLSPRAMSLNGELGIAFGARGMGAANAHYEPGEVVINLTKTRGAGSLAHEWWHAFDNYMMRRSGNPMLYGTEALTMDGTRAEVAKAFRELAQAIAKSPYHQRSMLRGAEYWGSTREESARLFGEWVVAKLAERDGVNHFLSRGVDPGAMDLYKELSYLRYRREEMIAGRKPQPFKEWLDTTETDPLGDYPYPTPEELAELSKPMQHLVDVLEERRDKGEVMEPGANYQLSLFDAREKPAGAIQRGLFDSVEQQASRLPEQEGKRLMENAEITDEEVDRYTEAYNNYLEQAEAVERQLKNYKGDEEGRRELEAELESYGDRFNERQSETARTLVSYFRQLGNTAKDAERMSRDKLAQFRADVEMRRRGLYLRMERKERGEAAMESLPELSADSKVAAQTMTTAGDELIRFNSYGRLPRAEQGEFCTVERQFTTTGEFDFTGNGCIESADDVAYVFRSLESYAVENTFAMLVKDGRPIIMHLGMGSATASIVDMSAVRASFDAYGADDVYLVHNHPSGVLRCSVPDVRILNTLRGMLEGKANVHAIIMDTTSGKYGTFDVDMSHEEHVRPTTGGDEGVATYRFNKLDPRQSTKELGQIRSANDVTRVLTELRLGTGDKIGVLVLNNNGNVVGNFLTPYADLKRSQEIANEAAGYAVKHGGTSVILYGNNIKFSSVRGLSAEVAERSGNSVKVLDVISVDNGLNRSAQDSGLMNEPSTAYAPYVNDDGMKRRSVRDAEWRQRTIDERGVVMPGLAGKSVNVVELEKHPFNTAQRTVDLKKEAKNYAMDANIIGVMSNEETGGKGQISISRNSIDKFIDDSAANKGVGKDAHLSVLPRLRDVIRESVLVESHPDYNKVDGVRSVEAGHNKDVVIHRLYGAVKFGDETYRVKTTIKENVSGAQSYLKAYSYEVQEIELLPGQYEETAKMELSSRNDNSSKDEAQESTQNNMETLAITKLLKDVEKSYDKGVKILDASRKEDERLYKQYDLGGGEPMEVHDDSQPRYGLEEVVTNGVLRMAEKQAESWRARSDAYRAIGGNLSHILQGMSVQKGYDQGTVKRVTDLAQVMLQNGQMTGLSSGEVKRLLSAVKNANGRKDIRKQLDGVVDIMLNSQLRNQEATLDRLLSTRGKKLSPKGIEIAGRLSGDALAQISTFRKMREADTATISAAIGEAINAMGSEDAGKAERAALQYDALMMAQRYKNEVVARRTEVSALGESMRLSHEEMRNGIISRQAYNEFVESCRRTQRELKVEIGKSLSSLTAAMSGVIDSGRANAGVFADREKERVRNIYRMVNEDMGWVSSDIHKTGPTIKQKIVNAAASSIFSTLPTFNEMLKIFCPMAPGGEGRLYRHYMPKWVVSAENEYAWGRKAFDTLAEKASEILDVPMEKWEKLGLRAREMEFKTGERELTVLINDNSGDRKIGLRVPEVAYIYAVNKMEDGRIKLNKMGLSDMRIREMTSKLPEEIRKLVDWLQEGFLPEMRRQINEVHIRMFGTEIAEIENYFPLQIHRESLYQGIDLSNPEGTAVLSSVVIGSLINRTRNTKPLELLKADLFNVVADHVQKTVHWMAYCEFIRDLNTLLSIGGFRTRVKNMTSIFGSGEVLWDKLIACSQMVCGTYKPLGSKHKNLDSIVVNTVKPVTTAKVSFMPWTAIKQLTSFPAFFATASVPELAYAGVHIKESFKWCLDNLPLFHKRWVGRMAGNEKLLPTNLDISTWRKGWVEKLSKWGMTPNAFVDVLTIAWGTYATYNTKYKRYIKYGYSPERAREKARIEATIAYNETQQSSEAAFVSESQLSRTWYAVMLTAFRTGPIGYQRKLLSATRDIHNAITINGEVRQQYLRRQLEDDGLSAVQAAEAARKISGRMVMDAVVLGASIGLLALTWNLGGNSPYSIFGGNDEAKAEIAKNDVVHSVYDTMLQGLAGGDILSAGLTALTNKGRIGKYDLQKDMPFVSDLNRIIEEFGYDDVAAWNDLVNLAVQTGVGVNPQVISNWVSAVWDVLGNDARTAQEFTILMLRLLQAPQSQLDRIYFDELDMSGEQAKKCTPMEIARRYAEYKVRAGSNVLFYGMGFTSDETDRNRLKSYEKRAMKVMKEQMNRLYPDEVNVAYDKFKAVYERFKELDNGILQKHADGEVTFEKMVRELKPALYKDPDYEIYLAFVSMNQGFNEMVKGLIGSKTPEEANAYREALRRLKAYMAEYYNANDQSERRRIQREGLKYSGEFRQRMYKKALSPQNNG